MANPEWLQRMSEPPSNPAVATTHINLSTFNLQTNSPLYTIPAELRTLIFTYTLTSSSDPTQPYSHTARNIWPSKHFPRISYPYRQLLSTALLQTCKRIYLETRHLPIALNEHVFWPRDFREPIYPSIAVYPIHTAPYFKKMTAWQQAEVRRVRFNIPEQGTCRGNMVIQKIARVFLKKKTTGLMDPELDLTNLHTLVLDCHNPVFRISENYESLREENMGTNYGDAAELIRDLRGLRELIVVLDYRPGSKVLRFVKGLDLGHLSLVDEGTSEEVYESKGPEEDTSGRNEESSGDSSDYVIKQLRWVAR